ncbi:hypothetical protein BDN72DRAFT_836149 [Pluteus cervinus]|uniref:Uncharacterized protein n=1 Tax=Pluteus cervinus TaxID=181527 RepID=A0ACD3B3X7_9AGAR|nr:hypothetical protein BDN72DRAFT_836149 [Pluteus cervinus]
MPFLDGAEDLVFMRVGAIYPDGAKIVVRHPVKNETEHVLQLLWREARPEKAWERGPTLNLTESRDWVGTVQLGGLWPSTEYEYTLATDEGNHIRDFPKPLRFKTFPDPRLGRGSQFRFIASSCITPNFPYGGPTERKTIHGFDLMSEYLDPHSTKDVSPAPPMEFILFLGDFIYADVPIYWGNAKEAYRRLYRRNYQSPSFRKVYEKYPIVHAYDDHEIINNFSGEGNSSLQPYENAEHAFNLYNGEPNYSPFSPGHHYYNFSYGDTAFFIMDTRRYRSAPVDDLSTRTMLGDDQLYALYDWLSKVNTTSTFKFIVSSVPLTSLWGHDAATDSWAGFPTEKSALLSAFHSVPNVFVISGDRHEFAAIEFNSAHGHTVHEFSTSPLNMFYIPFIRTLKQQSDQTVEVYNQTLNTDAENTTIFEAAPPVPLERVFKYIPTGNHKWSTFEIDTREADKPMLRLSVLVDGDVAYNWTYVGKPLKVKTASALGLFTSGGIEELVRKFGMNPRKWF